MDFAALPEERQVERLAVLAREALRAWDIDLADVEPVKYRENATFSVRSSDGRRWAMRVQRPGYRSARQVLSEFAWIRDLDAHGVPVPQPFAARGGELLVEQSAPGVPQPRLCALIEWVPGASQGSLMEGVALGHDEVRATYHEVGRLAAVIQAHGESWTAPSWFTRPSWGVDDLVGDAPALGRFEDLPGIEPQQLAVCSRAKAALRERLAALGPVRALVHGDLLPDNLLVDGAVMRVIDFDECGWSWPCLEMATSLFPLKVSRGFDAGLDGYLEGYRSVRPFPALDLELLPDMVMARALSYLGWTVNRPEIHSVREMAPLLAAGIGDMAERYLLRAA